MSNPFFKNHGPINISKIIKFLNLNIQLDGDKLADCRSIPEILKLLEDNS